MGGAFFLMRAGLGITALLLVDEVRATAVIRVLPFFCSRGTGPSVALQGVERGMFF
jgi:hypothetical protein